MTEYELLSIVIAGLGFVLALISIFTAGKALNTNKNMFKRQGVIDLHMAWNGVNEIDPSNLNTPDIVNAINAMTLTASLWNHDVIEKPILYQSYWDAYKDLYDTISSCASPVPGIHKRCDRLITKEITRAYEDMKNVDLNTVLQTTL